MYDLYWYWGHKITEYGQAFNTKWFFILWLNIWSKCISICTFICIGSSTNLIPGTGYTFFNFAQSWMGKYDSKTSLVHFLKRGGLKHILEGSKRDGVYYEKCKEILKNASGHTLKLNTFHHSGSIKEKKNLTYQYV